MDANIVKWGNSQGIRLSKEVLEMVGLSVNDKVNITLTENKEIVISKAKDEEVITFKSLFDGWTGGAYEGGEFVWGDEVPVGKEIW